MRPSEETPYKYKEYLRKKYTDEKMTLREIAEELGVSAQTISKYKRKHGIPANEWWKGYVQIGPHIPQVLKEKLLERRNGRTFSEVVRQALWEYVLRNE